MTEDRNGKTYSFDICSKCTLICCQGANPPLTEERKKILTQFLQTQKRPTQNIFAKETYSHPATDAQDICVFYDKATRKCSVHQAKPETCRAGPITFDINVKTGKVEYYLKKEGICAFAGVLYRDKPQLAVHLKAARQEILHLIEELDADALKAILTIPEPETFKIAEDPLPAKVAKKLEIN
jgi:Fe-S-cluster containining protein